MPKQQTPVLKRWRSLFAREIGVVDALNRRIQAGEPVSMEEVQKGTELAERLLGLLRAALATADNGRRL
jgi:hypothetical protein